MLTAVSPLIAAKNAVTIVVADSPQRRGLVAVPILPDVFCSRRTLSIAYVLEFSTSRQEKLDVEANAFYA